MTWDYLISIYYLIGTISILFKVRKTMWDGEGDKGHNFHEGPLFCRCSKQFLDFLGENIYEWLSKNISLVCRFQNDFWPGAMMDLAMQALMLTRFCLYSLVLVYTCTNRVYTCLLQVILCKILTIYTCFTANVDGTPRILRARYRHVEPIKRRTRFSKALVAVPVALWRGKQTGRNYDDTNAEVPQSFPAGYAQVSTSHIIIHHRFTYNVILTAVSPKSFSNNKLIKLVFQKHRKSLLSVFIHLPTH